MLQKFNLDISKVDRMLYMLQYDSPATAYCCSCRSAVYARDKLMIISKKSTEI